MLAFRIADQRFPIFDGSGARLIRGRWNSPGHPVIYTAETFAGALLEILAHSNLGRIPTTHSVIEVKIPDDLAMESVDAREVPGWDAADQIASRARGDLWLNGGGAAVLIVPSTVTRGREKSILINTTHPDFGRISATAPQPVRWDERLFQRR